MVTSMIMESIAKNNEWCFRKWNFILSLCLTEIGNTHLDKFIRKLPMIVSSSLPWTTFRINWVSWPSKQMSNYVMEQESQCLFLGKTCEIFKIQHDVDMKLTYLHLASFQECTVKMRLLKSIIARDKYDSANVQQMFSNLATSLLRGESLLLESVSLGGE